jgi:hypothetical protein
MCSAIRFTQDMIQLKHSPCDKVYVVIYIGQRNTHDDLEHEGQPPRDVDSSSGCLPGPA